MATIAIIDYGMGNLRSVAKALEHVAPKMRVLVTQRSADILQADQVVLPGQSAIRDAMRELMALDLIAAVQETAPNKPFFGLCLGPPALMDFSEENNGTECLGILPGKVVRFDNEMYQAGARLKIPHMGWNQVHQTTAHPLWQGIPQDSRFYFVHSYYLKPAISSIVAGTTQYGAEFTSVVARDNIFAVQFHPEKSAAMGLRLLANFTQWNPT